jgi:hypothetical protein
MCISKNDFKWIFGFSTDELSNEPVCLNPDNHLLFTKLKNLTMTRKNKTSEFLNMYLNTSTPGTSASQHSPSLRRTR